MTATATSGTVTAKPARDPRVVALRRFAISITVFNIVGYTLLGFEQPWTWPIIAVATAYAMELLLEVIGAHAERRPVRFRGGGVRGLVEFLFPAHITGIAVNMLLYLNDQVLVMMFGVTVAVGTKWVLRAPVRGRLRHFMNPSNFGITIALLAFGWVNIAPPYHFTEHVPDVIRLMVPIIIITAGTVLNAMLTKKVPLILGWVGGFVIQAIVRAEIWDVALWAALAPMTGVAFVLFTNYMITDPGTSPSTGKAMFMFGASVATVYGILMVFNVVYTLFFATAIVCGARGLLWWFKWMRERRRATAPALS